MLVLMEEWSLVRINTTRDKKEVVLISSLRDCSGLSSPMPAQQHFKLYPDAGHFPQVLTCCSVSLCFVGGNILMNFSL